MIISMAMVYMYGHLAINIVVILIMTIETVMEKCIGLMGLYTEANGLKEYNRELVKFLILMGAFSEDNLIRTY